MNNIKINRAWAIVYPVGIYYVITNVATFLICLFVPLTNESYGFIKVLSTLLTLPFIYRIYRADEMRRGYLESEWKTVIKSFRKEISVIVGIVLMAACLSVVLNNILAWTPLIETSKSYQQVAKAFFGGGIIFEILGPCILVPILEEYVFRGLVYCRLREWLSLPWAVGISAVIFGVMHMNLVQFIYAGLLGIFLALCAERTEYLYGAIAGHMAANTISVIRTETEWLKWMEHPFGVKLCMTIGLGLVFVGLAVIIFRKKRDTI